jgi:hypothetical protein
MLGYYSSKEDKYIMSLLHISWHQTFYDRHHKRVVGFSVAVDCLVSSLLLDVQSSTATEV